MSVPSLRKLLLMPLVLVPLLLALGIGLYAAFGFWVVPRIVHSQARQYVEDELHRELRLGTVTFNPFTFTMELRDAAILEKGQKLVGFKRLFANYRFTSFFTRDHELSEVELDQPYTRAIIRRDGSLNLVDLLPKSDPDEPMPSVRIDEFDVRGGKVDFADRSRRLEPTKTLAPLTFHLRDFHTTEEGGDLRLDTRTEDGEGLVWQGDLGLAPLASKGRITITGLQAGTLHEFLSEELPMVLSGGSFDLGGTYIFAVKGKQGMQFDAVLPKIASKGLRLRARGVDRDWVTLPAASLEDTRLSLDKREVTINVLKMAGLQAEVWLEPDGSLNLGRLFAPASATSSSGGAGGGAVPEREWALRLTDIELEDATVHLEDRTVQPIGKFDLASLSAHVGGFSLDMTRALPVTMTATVNGQAPLRLQGEVVPDPLAADLELEISKLPLMAVATYLPDYPSLDVRSGDVGAKGKLVMRPEGGPGPALSYDGEASIANFKQVEKVGGREFLSWDRLDFSGIAYRAAPDSLEVRRITARRPFARVVIKPDRTVNLAVLAAPTPKSTQAGASKGLAASTLPLKIGEVVLDNGTMGFADLSIDPNFQARIEALRGRIAGISTEPHSVAQLDLAGHVVNRHSPVTIKGRANLLDYDEQTDVAMTFRNIELPIFNPYSGRFAGYAIAKGKLTTDLHYTINQRKLVADHHLIIDQLQWGQATESKQKVTLPIRLATSLLKDVNGVIDLKLPVTGSLDDPKFRIGPIIWQIIKNIIVKVATAPFRFLGSLFKGAEDAQYVDFQPGSAELPDKAKSSLPELAKSLKERPELKIDVPAGQVTEADVAALDDQRFQEAIARLREGRRGAKTAYADLDDENKIDVLKDLYRQEFGHRPDLPDAADATAAGGATEPEAAIAADRPATGAVALAADEPASSELQIETGETGNPETMVAMDESPVPQTSNAAGEDTEPLAGNEAADEPVAPPAATAAAAPAKELTRRERKASKRQAQVAWLEGQLRPRFKAAPADRTELARARATAVQEALLADGSLDPGRVFLAGNLSPVAKDDVVRMELALK